MTTVRESGRVRGRAELGLRFTRLRTDAVTYDIRTAPLRWIAEATKGEDATKVAIGAAAVAVIGAITGGGKGAAVGSAVGVGGGSAVVLATKGEESRLGAGTRLRVEPTEPISVVAPSNESEGGKAKGKGIATGRPSGPRSGQRRLDVRVLTLILKQDAQLVHRRYVAGSSAGCNPDIDPRPASRAPPSTERDGFDFSQAARGHVRIAQAGFGFRRMLERSATSHPRSTRRVTIGRLPWPESDNSPSGKPGTIQRGCRRNV